MIESMSATYYTLAPQCKFLCRPAWTGPRFDGVSPQRDTSNSVRIQLALDVYIAWESSVLSRNNVTPPPERLESGPTFRNNVFDVVGSMARLCDGV